MSATPRLLAVTGTVAVFALALTGCSGSQTAAAPDKIKVAYAGDLDPNDIADQIGIQKAGATVTSLNDDNNVVQGVQKGSFELGNVDTTSAIAAIQAGIPIKIVYVSQNMPEFVMISQPDITSISQLAGKAVAYDSEGSETETLEKQLAAQESASLVDQIKWSALSNSPNRAAAMVAKRLDATTVEYADLLSIEKKAHFNELGNWSDLQGESGDAIATVWIASDKYLADHRSTVESFLKDVQAGYDTAYSDKDTWLKVAEKTLPDVDADDLASTYDYYTKSGMYPKSGTPPITTDRWSGMDKFYLETDSYKKSAPIDTMVDLKMVDAVNG